MAIKILVVLLAFMLVSTSVNGAQGDCAPEKSPPPPPSVEPPMVEPPATPPTPVVEPPSVEPPIVEPPPVEPPVVEPPMVEPPVPVVEPPTTEYYPPITTGRGRTARCLKYCASAVKGKRVCFRTCTACAAKYGCVPLDSECKDWSEVERYGYTVRCP